MRTIVRLLVAVSALVSMGCAKHSRSYQSDGFGGTRAALAMVSAPASPSTIDRKIIWRASLRMEVGHISNPVARLTMLVETQRG